MKILAIDPASTCGWAIANGAGIIAAGTWDLSVRRDESTGMRLLRLRAKLAEVITSERPDLVVFERSTGHGPGAMAVVSHAELQGVVKVFCEARGLQYRGYSPGEIKRWATGKGNANKAAILEAAERKWGKVTDDNEADARWLADLAASTLTTERGVDGR